MARTAAAKLATAAVPSPPNPVYLQVPILIYHYPPADFEIQLEAIRNKGYTTIDLDQLANAIAHRSTIPAESVVITFDNGFTNQMQAFTLLKKYSMKANFYIIDGGSGSNWCIVASRRYDDPLQPPPGLW